MHKFRIIFLLQFFLLFFSHQQFNFKAIFNRYYSNAYFRTYQIVRSSCHAVINFCTYKN